MLKNVKTITVLLLLGCTLALSSILGREFCTYQENPNKELDFFNEVNPFLEVSAPSVIQSLVFGTVQGNIDDLDPHYSYDTDSYDVINQVVEQLYQFKISDPDLPIIPWLASVMPTISPDGTEYTITLRQGIKFHDGSDFNAAAVKWSFDRLCYFMNYSGNQDLPPPFNVPLPDTILPTQIRHLYEQPDGKRIINKTEVLSTYQVKITLNAPKASFMSLLCITGSGILSPDSTPPLRYYELDETLIGTGPFQYVGFIADIEVRFEGNSDYWGTPDNTGPPQLETLTYMIVPDYTTLGIGLLSGDVDIIDSMDPSFIPQFQADPNIECDEYGNTLTVFWTTFNYDHIDLAMRRGLSWCFDYTYMIDVICEGVAVRWPTYIPNKIPYANYNLDYPTYDLARARQYLLEDSGYGATLAAAGIDENSPDDAWTALADGAAPLASLNYTYNIGNDIRRDNGLRLASDARYIGVDIEVNGVIFGDLLDMIIFEREKMDMYGLGWGPDYLDPENYINPIYSDTSAFNGGNFYEPDVQQLMDDGLTETDPVAREAIYDEIQRLMVEEYLPAMTLYTPKNYDAWRVGIHGWVPNPINRLDFYSVYIVDMNKRMRTSTSLRVGNYNIMLTEPGDEIILYGKVYPIISKKVPLQMKVLHPDGTYEYDGILWTDDFGYYILLVVVKVPGNIHVEVDFLGDADYLPSGSEMPIPIRPQLGMAIIVAATAGLSSGPVIEYIADLAVQTLRCNGILDEQNDPDRNRIWYMHPDIMRDIEGDGQPDVDAEPTLANLVYAISTWAAELVQMKDDQGNWWAEGVLNTPLTVYLIGCTIPTGFYMNQLGETISSSSLDGYLDMLEQQIINEFIAAGVEPPPYLPINVIIEGPLSGNFIAPLSQPGRIIISSTDVNGFNYWVSGGSSSFSAYFLSRIGGGFYIQSAFAYGKLMVESIPIFREQKPQLDANGNGIPNQIGDEIATATADLYERKHDWRLGFGNARPKITNALGQITISSQLPYMFWVFGDDPEGSTLSVKLTVYPPEESFEETHTITLTQSLSNPRKYEGVYDGFYGEGVYTLIYTATDEAGNEALPINKTVTVFDPNPPVDVTDLRVTAAYDGTVSLKWYPSVSPDTQGYKVYVKRQDGGAEYLWGDVGYVHEVDITGLNFFLGGYYEFRVTAYDRVPLESVGSTCTYDPDTDDDGLLDVDEFILGTDPLDPDIDDDWLSDGEEVYDYGTEPLLWDSDGDGISDGDEVIIYGTDPLANADTYTPAEPNVQITDQNYDISLTFDDVTVAGATTIEGSETGPSLPAGFQLGDIYYSITTTANYTGTIHLEIPYDEEVVGDENFLTLMHYNEGTGEWEDITVFIDMQNNIIYGEVESLSIFGLFIDITPPSITMETPGEDQALQDGIVLIGKAEDLSGVIWVNLTIREDDGANGIFIHDDFENMPAAYNEITKEWQLFFDTTELPDGFYLLIVESSDRFGLIGVNITSFSIRNWATLELLPATVDNKAGRTMPVKFSLRVVEAVDLAMPFVRNEELDIKIFDKNSGQLLQNSTFGDASTDYRIDDGNELYITNFKTSKTPATYVVEIYRKGMFIGSFEFSTFK